MDAVFDLIFGALDLLRRVTESPTALLHSLVLPVALVGYVAAALTMHRHREASPWIPLLVLVPAAAVVSDLLANAVVILFFIITLGGNLQAAIPFLGAVFAACIGAGAGVLASQQQDSTFRGACWVSAVVSLLWFAVHQGGR